MRETTRGIKKQINPMAENGVDTRLDKDRRMSVLLVRNFADLPSETQ